MVGGRGGLAGDIVGSYGCVVLELVLVWVQAIWVRYVQHLRKPRVCSQISTDPGSKTRVVKGPVSCEIPDTVAERLLAPSHCFW